MDFVRLHWQRKIPLLRRVASLAASTVSLKQIRKRKEDEIFPSANYVAISLAETECTAESVKQRKFDAEQHTL